MNMIRPNPNTLTQPNLIILENNARGRFWGLLGRSDHSKDVEKNARLLNPNINVSRKNSRLGYYPNTSESMGLKSWIQSYVRGYLKGNHEDLSEILKEKKGNATPTVINISQGTSEVHILKQLGKYSSFAMTKMTAEEKKRLLDTNFNTLDFLKLETFIDTALKHMQTEIKDWQTKIKDVVQKLKKQNVVVVTAGGNDNKLLKELDPKFRKQMEADEAVDPLFVGTGIIGVGAAKPNGELSDYSTRGDHYQFAIPTPDGRDEGTSFSTPGFSVVLLDTMTKKKMTPDQALAYLRKMNPRKIDDQGNAYTYIPLPKKT